MNERLVPNAIFAWSLVETQKPMTEQLLAEMRDALTVAHEYEQAGLHATAYQYGQLAARKIEQALAEGWGDNEQLTVKGDLMRVPGPDVHPTQLDYS